MAGRRPRYTEMAAEAVGDLRALHESGMLDMRGLGTRAEAGLEELMRDSSYAGRVRQFYPEDLNYSAGYIRYLVDSGSPLARMIVDGEHSFSDEVRGLFPFYAHSGGEIPADYIPRLTELLRATNNLRLSCKGAKQNTFLSSPLSDGEISSLGRRDAEAQALIAAIRDYFPSPFRQAYGHLKARAAKADDVAYIMVSTMEETRRIVKGSFQ
ncbi:MAG: hypothetical protein HY367_04255 [Candidatus Aenigmarchaeota archaeon]|nr:hypothetical protein [Candidatus Aenigmarchaeota archaeon]